MITLLSASSDGREGNHSHLIHKTLLTVVRLEKQRPLGVGGLGEYSGQAY